MLQRSGGKRTLLHYWWEFKVIQPLRRIVGRFLKKKKRGINLPHALCCAKSLQSCPALCDTLDFSLSGYSVHGISQARILKWVAISSSRGSSQNLHLLHWQVDSLPLSHLGIPRIILSFRQLRKGKYRKSSLPFAYVPKAGHNFSFQRYPFSSSTRRRKTTLITGHETWH